MSKISELAVVNVVNSADRLVLLVNTSGTANLRTITSTNFINSLPMANATVAGFVKVGNNLSVNTTGYLYVSLPDANTTVAGLIKVGNNLSVNSTGYLSSTGGGGSGYQLVNGDFTVTLYDSGRLEVDNELLVNNDVIIGSPTTFQCRISVNDETGDITIYSIANNVWTDEWVIKNDAGVPKFVLANNATINNHDGSHYLTKVVSDVVPVTTEQSLGSPELPWKHLYLSNGTIYIANTPLTISQAGELIVNGQTTYATLGQVVNTSSDFIPSIIRGSSYTIIDGGHTCSARQYIEFDGGSASDEYPCEYIIDCGCADITKACEPFIYNYDTIKLDRLTNGDETVTINEHGGLEFNSGQLIIGGDSNSSYISSDISIGVSVSNVHITNTSKTGLRVFKTLTTEDIKLRGRLLDALSRPIFNTNSLDINTDGGTSISVFSIYDLQFDGGSESTVFGLYEAGLDGGCSFNNLMSSQFIDGGSALVQ